MFSILKPHNQKPYMEITSLMDNNVRNIIYVSGVGTGKSFVFMAVAGRVKGLILYVVPKQVVVNNIMSYEAFSSVSDRVDFVTYNAFTDEDIGRRIIEDYDMVVVDECHHLGSDLYGKVLSTIMQERHTFFLGLTATPVRDADGFDVTAYFDKRVDGITNFEAISLGIMPTINYQVCLPERDPKQVEAEYENEVRAVLSYRESEDVLQAAVNSFPKDKWICFFPTVQALESHKELVTRLFPEHRIFVLYATLNNLDEVIEGLKNCKKAVVLSCNILLEGAHLQGIRGIILFRNVTSLNAFQQMIGRVCSVTEHIQDSPVVLDCSTCAVRLMAKLLAGTGKSRNDSILRTPSGKEIVEIGLGEYRSYDIQKLLLLAQGTAITEKEEKAVEKYRLFNGKSYHSITAFQNSGLDFKKIKACCELYGASLRGAMMLITTG